MKPLDSMITITMSFLLAACSQYPVEPAETATVSEESVEEARSAAAERSVEQVSEPAPPEEVAEEAPAQEKYLPVADWLVQRHSACQQDREAIDAQLLRARQELAEGEEPADEAARLVQAYAQLKALMLASCTPARTPGLLNNFLNSVERYDHWPPEYSGLFALLRSEQQAYALLEDKYRELQTLHKETIDGIGNIEQSLENESRQ